jgi:hypothetical protein
MSGTNLPFRKADLNPYAMGFQPAGQHSTDNVHSPSTLCSRPSSSTSCTSFASQLSRSSAKEGDAFFKSLADFRLGDPFRANSHSSQGCTTMATHDGGHEFHRVPGHNPNFSLSKQYSPADGYPTGYGNSETPVASNSMAIARFASPHSSPRRISNKTAQSSSTWANSTPASNTSFYNSSFNSWKDNLDTSVAGPRQRHDSRQEEAAHHSNSHDVSSFQASKIFVDDR